MKKLKKIPNFKSTKQEKAFWMSHDSTEFVDWTKAEYAVFPHLKPSTKSISLRLPEGLLNDIKVFANKEDIPYQSLMKMLLAQGMRTLRKND